jgi:hypothetical protein
VLVTRLRERQIPRKGYRRTPIGDQAYNGGVAPPYYDEDYDRYCDLVNGNSPVKSLKKCVPNDLTRKVSLPI